MHVGVLTPVMLLVFFCIVAMQKNGNKANYGGGGYSKPYPILSATLSLRGYHAVVTGTHRTSPVP